MKLLPLTYLKRSFIVRWRRFFYTANTTQIRGVKPKNPTIEEKQAMRIWSKIVHYPDSVLLYNPISHDCFVEWTSDRGKIFLFLESQNIRVINTVVGYDIRLSSSVENWCSYVFSKEVAKRREKFRKSAEEKVLHSLDSLESTI